MSGILITLEGPEGSGKTTQAEKLGECLRGTGREVLQLREPGGTATGEMMRNIIQHNASGEDLFPETEIFLFEASRCQLVRGVIVPALEKGTCVLCDRFADSTTAYQGYGRGFDVEMILNINNLAVDGVVPDLTVLLDIEVQAGFHRLDERNTRNKTSRDRIEREDMSFHERVRAGYLELAGKWPERIRIVDADRGEDEVAADVWRLVEQALESHDG